MAIWLAATIIGIAAANKISLLLKLFKHRSHIALMSLGLALIVATNKTDAIKELLRSLERQGAIDDYVSAEKAVFDREASMSTGMEFGVAIPHGRTDAVSRLVATIGLKPEGIEFESLDGMPATIIVLALSPTPTKAPHMQFMAMMSNALDEHGRQAILKCSSKSDMMKVLSR